VIWHLDGDASEPASTAGRVRTDGGGVACFLVPPPAYDADGLTRGLEQLGELIAKVG